MIAPTIDPFTVKNRDVPSEVVEAILLSAGIIHGSNGHASFERSDGTKARIQRRASLIGDPVAADACIVVQISRWDRLKDPVGVLDSFARCIAPSCDSVLILAGPGASSVKDDPEEPEVLREVTERLKRLPKGVRSRVQIAQLPMEDADENAAIVNALQRRADVVVQKSLAEGFGLTVAEAMWKARPIVASRVGGIGDQIENGVSGVLVDDPKDLDAFGSSVVDLLKDPTKAEQLGESARDRTIHEFIAPRHLIQQAQLILSLLRSN